jgi:hypothetical protein
MNQISREKLEYTAKKVLHYPLHDAEKRLFPHTCYEINFPISTIPKTHF